MEPFPKLAAALSGARVRFLVIGVSGVNHYAQTAGLVFTTQDRDLFLPPDPDNELAAWHACQSEGFELWCGDEPLGEPMDSVLAEQVVFRLALVRASGHGLLVDLTLVMAGCTFDDVWSRRRVFKVEGVEVPVASLSVLRAWNPSRDGPSLEIESGAMRNERRSAVVLLLAVLAALPSATAAAPRPAPADQRLEALKREAAADVDRMQAFTQRTIDTIFSFGELGFQEVETSRYLVGVLRENGFQVQEGVFGIPTAWIATWGTGKPVISLGSDIDCIPKASQKPGVAWHMPLVEGAPGHGEGHNSGQAVNITAAIAVKKIMERERLPGTLVLWPGVAEELLGTKAYYVREGLFKDTDVVLFSHVDSEMKVTWGQGDGSGLVSVEYTFHGEPAHAGVAPWRGRSALDAVELMDAGWNFRREHLRTEQRSHYVITRGGDQPNVVPSLASVWYYFRELDYPQIQALFEAGNTIAKAAAAMTETTVEWRILGAAWPQHFNKPVAEAMHENMKVVGMPSWSEADQTLAKGVQRELKGEQKGLETKVGKLEPPPEQPKGGGSDDIGDVSWTVPTITLRYPSNIPGLPGHHWANAVAMATPLAHKGATAGAKVQAMTILDLLLRPELISQAWSYFRDVQTKDTKYTPLIGPKDVPAVWLNRETMERYRPEMRKYYFDAARYKTYLEQLGVTYPTVR